MEKTGLKRAKKKNPKPNFYKQHNSGLVQMPKANDFVCTLAPMKNLIISNNHKAFYKSSSWLEKVFQYCLEPGENRLSDWLDCQGQTGALNTKRGSGLLLLETLTLNNSLSSDLQQTLITISRVLCFVKHCGRCPFKKKTLGICFVSQGV